MSGWKIRLEDRDGMLVPVAYYDSGPDEDGYRHNAARRDEDCGDTDEREINDEWMGEEVDAPGNR